MHLVTKTLIVLITVWRWVKQLLQSRQQWRWKCGAHIKIWVYWCCTWGGLPDRITSYKLSQRMRNWHGSCTGWFYIKYIASEFTRYLVTVRPLIFEALLFQSPNCMDGLLAIIITWLIINYCCGCSLDKLHHMVQNWMMGIRGEGGYSGFHVTGLIWVWNLNSDWKINIQMVWWITNTNIQFLMFFFVLSFNSLWEL